MAFFFQNDFHCIENILWRGMLHACSAFISFFVHFIYSKFAKITIYVNFVIVIKKQTKKQTVYGDFEVVINLISP